MKTLALCSLALCFPAQDGIEKSAGNGTAALAAPVRLECDSGPIDSGRYFAHSGPLFADLDGDKKQELLVGNLAGHFQRYANIGEPKAPKFVAKGLLQAGGADVKIHNW